MLIFKSEVLILSECKVGYKDLRIGGLSFDVDVDVEEDVDVHVDIDFEMIEGVLYKWLEQIHVHSQTNLLSL